MIKTHSFTIFLNISYAILAFITPVLLLADSAPPKQMIEVGLTAGGTYIAENWDLGEFKNNERYGFSGEFNLGFHIPNHFMDWMMRMQFSRMSGDRFHFQVTGDGQMAKYIQVHEILYKTDGQGTDQFRVLGGLGKSVKLGKWGEMVGSLGAAALLWQNGKGDSGDLYGAYAGGALIVKVWRLQNELRIAYVLAPHASALFAGDPANGIAQQYEMKNWKSGALLSNRFFVEAFRIRKSDPDMDSDTESKTGPVVGRLGPEIEFALEHLPVGEYIATLSPKYLLRMGFAGKF